MFERFYSIVMEPCIGFLDMLAVLVLSENKQLGLLYVICWSELTVADSMQVSVIVVQRSCLEKCVCGLQVRYDIITPV